MIWFLADRRPTEYGRAYGLTENAGREITGMKMQDND